MRVVLAVAVLAACHPPKVVPPPAPPPASPISDRMETFEINGYTLAGAEYWPYIGKEEVHYPHDVLWGFYPVKDDIAPGETEPNTDSATKAAIDCAQESFAALQLFLSKNPPALRDITQRGEAQGFVPRFYLWTNDYSRAADPYPLGRREPRLWYWKRKQPEAGKPPGYWKWEATLTQTGECKLPEQDQIDQYLADTLKSLDSHP